MAVKLHFSQVTTVLFSGDTVGATCTDKMELYYKWNEMMHKTTIIMYKP